MPKESCLRRVDGGYFLFFHEWAIDACDGDPCAALLLSRAEYCHNGILSGKANLEVIGTSFKRSLKDWRLDLFKSFTLCRIRHGLKILEQKGFLTSGRHPEIWNRGDCTRWYEFHPEVVNKWLDENEGDFRHGRASQGHNLTIDMSDNHGPDCDDETCVNHCDYACESPQDIENKQCLETENEQPCGYPHACSTECPQIVKNKQNSNSHLVNKEKEKKENKDKNLRERDSFTPNAGPEPTPYQPPISPSQNSTVNDPFANRFDQPLVDAANRVLADLQRRLHFRIQFPVCDDLIAAVKEYGERYLIDEYNKWVAEAPNTPFHNDDGERSKCFMNAIKPPSLYGTKLGNNRVAVAEWIDSKNRPTARRKLTLVT